MKYSKVFLLFPLIGILAVSCSPGSHSSSLGSTTSSEESSSATTTQEPIVSEDGVYDFYCVNDFHGSILERDDSYYESGIKKYFSKLKQLKEADPEHTFIFSAGDMFQGSLESNYYYGQVVVDAMNEAGFDAMAIGNHEFDYGQDKLFANIERADFPFLGGNILKWDGGQTDEPFDDRVKASTIIERGGNKVGIIGMIGGTLETSITGACISNCYFANPEKLIKQESESLRAQGCSMIILLIHDDVRSLYGFSDIKDYVDGVFTGHSHSKNLTFIGDGVPAVQSYCNGEYISHFTLQIKDLEVTCTDEEIIEASPSWTVDQGIEAVVDSYLDDDFEAMANRVAGTLSGQLNKTEVGNLGARAIYEEYVKKYPDIMFAIENSQRASLYPGDITYSDLYKATPFTNEVCIIEVQGVDIVSMLGRNCAYTDKENAFASIELTEYYQVAAIDYLATHQSESKSYDYFPSLNRDGKIIASCATYPMDLSFDYIQNELGGVIDADDFASGQGGFSPYQ